MEKHLILLLPFFLVWQSTALSGQIIPDHRRVNWSDVGSAAPASDWPVYNILDYGGIADGSVANDGALGELLLLVMNEPGIIYFPPGNYLFKEAIELPDSTVLRGESAATTQLLFDLDGTEYAIRVEGHLQAGKVGLAEMVAFGDSLITTTVPVPVAPGDLMMLSDIDTAKVTSPWALLTSGQINRLTSVNGDELVFQSAFRRDYALADQPWLQRIRPRHMVGIEQLSLQRLDVPEVKNSNILFHFAADCWVHCVESEYADFAHVEVARSTNVEVIGSYFHDAFSFGSGGKGYGVVLHYGSGECLVEGNVFRNLRHSLLLQAGANGNVMGYNYSRDPYWDEPGFPSNAAGDLVLHGNYPYANLMEGNIVQNIVVDESHGLQGPYNTFFRNRAEGLGLVFVSGELCASQNVLGNEVVGGVSLFLPSGPDQFLYGNNVNGMVVPAGTDGLSLPSLYLTEPPLYLAVPGAWPAVGYPNVAGSVINEAFARYTAGVPVGCSNTVLPAPIQPVTLGQEPPSLSSLPEIYPNPVQNELMISGLPPSERYLYQLLTSDGEILLNGSIVGGSTRIAMVHLPAGWYVLLLRDASGNLYGAYSVARSG